jgi:hypothetical protein
MWRKGHMIMKRLTIVLIALLVFQVALSVFLLWPRSTVSAAAPLFPKLSAGDIVALTVYDKPDASLALKKAGDKWVLPNADDYPASSTKVDALLGKIVALKTSRLVSQNATNQSRLKVAANDYLHRVDFQTADGANHTLYIGTSAGARATHVRSGDQNAVYLADDLNASDAAAQPAQWVDAAYLNVPVADVAGFTIKNANGTFKFSKGPNDTWLLDGLTGSETLNTAGITGLLGQIAALNMTKPLGKTAKPAYGLSQPGAEVTLTTRKDNQEQTYTLQVGNAKDPSDSTYVVKSSASPYYVGVAEFSVKDLIERKRESFLQAPPTPAAGAGAAPANPFSFGTPTPAP